MKFSIFTLCIIFFICCKSTHTEDNNYDMKTLTFKESAGALEDTIFFKSAIMLPLETDSSALIGYVSRIYMVDDTLFILDQNFQSIIIYDSKGRYINSIQNVGAGPKEYIDLGDICVDNTNKELLVLCTRPSKVQYYSYHGELLREKQLGDKYYSHIGMDGKYIYLHDDTGINKNKEIDIYDRQLNYMESALERGESFKNNDASTISHFCQGSTMTQGSSVLIARDFDNTIFEAKDGKVYPKYLLDFKEHTLPKELLDGKMKSFEFLDYCRENKYIISVKEFVESPRFLLFTTNLGVFVCDKQKQEMTRYSFLLNTESGMGGSDFQIIGNTNKLATVESVSRMKQMLEDRLKYNPDAAKWNVDFSKKINAMDDEANPVLFIYDF